MDKVEKKFSRMIDYAMEKPESAPSRVLVISLTKSKMEKMQSSPNLNTIIMIENVIKNYKGSVIKVAEIKRALPKQVNRNVLIAILKYLEKSGKIVITPKGITWLSNNNPSLRRAIAKGHKL